MSAPAWDMHDLPWPRDVAAAATAYAAGGELAWLDSAAPAPGSPARYSLVCTCPLAILAQDDGAAAQLTAGRRPLAAVASPWPLWRRAAATTLPTAPLPLAPGWVGYLGFPLARTLERIPPMRGNDLGLPILRLALFDRGIVLDHRTQRAFGLRARSEHGLLDDTTQAKHVPLDDWLDRWRSAATAHRPCTPPSPAPRVRPELSRDRFEHMVRRALDYVAAGDVYQVNLAQRLQIDGLHDPLALYRALRQANPAPYAALLSWNDGAVLSASPELFLRLHGRHVLTRPIKGTRPRTGHPAADRRHRHELLASAKEAAELAMIVDLHRNDLGRVCRYGTVRVPRPRRVEPHPTVFHTVADVVGRLGPDRDGLDLLAACFPAGSVTGVPKIRALEIIAELEPAPRGVYTGAIGVLSLDGNLTFNVAIRTIQVRGPRGTLHVGGGIVADSTPAAEYEETLAKARGILHALAPPAAGPPPPAPHPRPQQRTPQEPPPTSQDQKRRPLPCPTGSA